MKNKDGGKNGKDHTKSCYKTTETNTPRTEKQRY